MAESHWHRWQLTAPLAALSRPVRAAAGPAAPVVPTGPAAAAGGHVPVAGTVGPSAASGGTESPAGTSRPRAAAAEGLPVLLGDARARQVDGSTCGSAVLVMLAATGDPALAQWLETGRLPAGPRPPEVPAQDVRGGAGERFAAAQRQVKAATGRRALGPLPWPASLGTPPWTAAREARFPGVRYRVRPVSDSSPEAADVLGLVEAANRRGIPVPVYVGGDVRGGLSHAVPRHVVLAVPPPPGAALPGTLQVYEPAEGSVHTVPVSDLLGRTGPHPALGGWTHVTAVLLPVPA
ncbi:hypothetical protein FHE66_03870 [Georgenia sp. 311]|uniref:hypothetical protein n=1 Tax=Georgenia sp. 311 TaxID=2585134 RepID=UPI001112B66E|nr:hypothetical protein [Georgenia sp. 311]TNC19286.1 hypothetical protein FHE66_03870 [Georgenia sp. 311]